MPQMPTQARALVRDLLIQALLDHFGMAVAVWENRSLPTAPDKLPAIAVSTPHEKKVTLGRGDPLEYTTTVTAQLVIRTTGVDDRAAMGDLERLVGGVENAILPSQAILAHVNQFPSVESLLKVDSTGSPVTAEAVVHIECELQEIFLPPPGVPLARIEGDVPVGSDTTIVAGVDLPQV